MTSHAHLGTNAIAQALRTGLGLLFVWAILATSCTSAPPQGSPSPPTPPSTPTPSTPPDATQQPGGLFPLGTVTETSGPSSCHSEWTCYPFEVSCPEVRRPARGELLVQSSQGEARGLVVVLLGGQGRGFKRVNTGFVKGLTGEGLQVAIVDWKDSWLRSDGGEQVGPKRLACRSATVIRWVHDNLYMELGAPESGMGECGFCITGNSGGASQSAYALSFYGLATVVDAAVLSGGPPHAALDEGCLGAPEYAYPRRSAEVIDLSYGFRRGNGPCSSGDQGFSDRWEADSADVGGSYVFPTTRVVFLFVEGDGSVAPEHGMAYLSQIVAAGSPMVSDSVVPGRSHNIQKDPRSREALVAALLNL